ncbi:hypothetical protein IV203_015233 [Nitzschia inconspicua]|uniref:Uncharacterized protein n=1 Tax=Nitzschia inconspicua TaxID=303405 RepID=A0A9K3LBH1_9STRA|nr:hypothetical protein IV203_015233 [Nitzschia inconspicua]
MIFNRFCCCSSNGSASSSKCSRIPYGIILLTLSYLIFVLFVAFLAPECLDEPCNSEGLDNTTLGWATDFWIAAGMFWMGLHLWCCTPQSVYFSAIWSLWCMGAAYVLGGIGHSIYSNSGFDDNAGQQEFYITWAVSFTFMTMSVGTTYRFIRQVSYGCKTVGRCWRNFLTASLMLVILSWIATTGGYVWCSTEEDLHVDGVIDTVPPLDEDSEEELYQCLQLAAIAEFTWYAVFSLFLIPAGAILRTTVLETQLMEKGGERLTVYGFRAAWAALWIAIIPWTFGIMLIIYAGIAAIAAGKEGTEVYGQIYGAVIYHYGMLLGYFFFHNLAYSLPRDDERKERIANGGTSKSSSNKGPTHGDDDSC